MAIHGRRLNTVGAIVATVSILAAIAMVAVVFAQSPRESPKAAFALQAHAITHAHRPTLPRSSTGLRATRLGRSVPGVPSLPQAEELAPYGISAAPGAPGVAPTSRIPSAAVAIASFDTQSFVQDFLGPNPSGTPVAALATVTEAHPATPGVPGSTPFAAWVVTYQNAPAFDTGTADSGTSPTPSSACTLYGIVGAVSGTWANFFENCG